MKNILLSVVLSLYFGPSQSMAAGSTNKTVHHHKNSNSIKDSVKHSKINVNKSKSHTVTKPMAKHGVKHVVKHGVMTNKKIDKSITKVHYKQHKHNNTNSKTNGYFTRISWYGPGFHGRKTASGERFNQHAITAAHKTLPFGTKVKVTNSANNKSIVVRINDRGPFVRGREYDLSRGAATALGIHGVTMVHVMVDADS